MDAPDSLSSAAAGMRLQAGRLSLIAQNLANASTPGFHARLEAAGDLENSSHRAVNASRAEGTVRRTDVDTDLALVGSGYFSVAAPEGVRYTRDGRMTRDAAGFLCDSNGYRVLGALGPVRFAPGTSIVADGRVRFAGKIVDRLRLVDPTSARFDGGYALAAPGARLERATARVQQGHLEDSSVDAIAEMSALIAAQRSFEANQKSVQRVDETLKRAANDVARARS